MSTNRDAWYPWQHWTEHRIVLKMIAMHEELELMGEHLSRVRLTRLGREAVARMAAEQAEAEREIA